VASLGTRRPLDKYPSRALPPVSLTSLPFRSSPPAPSLSFPNFHCNGKIIYFKFFCSKLGDFARPALHPIATPLRNSAYGRSSTAASGGLLAKLPFSCTAHDFAGPLSSVFLCWSLLFPSQLREAPLSCRTGSDCGGVRLCGSCAVMDIISPLTTTQ